MKIVFMGTPDFALASLNALANRYGIAAVITQPDRKGNRNKTTPPPVKTLAQKRGIPVYQFEKVATEGIELLRELAPDLIVTCAFGQLLPQSILDIPPYGIFNVHASLLPKYRGAAPISWAVINGEKETGVTIMRTELAMDSGDIVLYKKTAIGEKETTGELFERLSLLGAEAIVEAVSLLEKGKAEFTRQVEEEASYCKQLKKADGAIDFSKTADKVFNHIRGMLPWPGAYTFLNGVMIKVLKAEKTDIVSDLPQASVVGQIKEGLAVTCADKSVIVFTRMQKEGGKPLDAAEFLRGTKIPQGTVLG